LFAIPKEALSFRASLPRDLSALIAQMNRQCMTRRVDLPKPTVCKKILFFLK
jgi:hypothetical protein